jgi:hypothetical protein
MRCAVPNGGSGVVDHVGRFVGAVTKDVAAEEEGANEEDGRESTSIGEERESPKRIGEGGRERIGIVSCEQLFGEERNGAGGCWYG